MLSQKFKKGIGDFNTEVNKCFSQEVDLLSCHVSLSLRLVGMRLKALIIKPVICFSDHGSDVVLFTRVNLLSSLRLVFVSDNFLQDPATQHFY